MPVSQFAFASNTARVGFSGDLTAIPQVITVDGVSGLPTGTVASIVGSLAIVNPTTATSVVYGDVDTAVAPGWPNPCWPGRMSTPATNTVVIENDDDEEIKLCAAGTAVSNIKVTVQGYFTKGNGSPAPGRYITGIADLGTTSALIRRPSLRPG